MRPNRWHTEHPIFGTRKLAVIASLPKEAVNRKRAGDIQLGSGRAVHDDGVDESVEIGGDSREHEWRRPVLRQPFCRAFVAECEIRGVIFEGSCDGGGKGVRSDGILRL